MSERAEQLRITAVTQVDELIGLVSEADEATLRCPCPGREKFGDGTIGTIVAHTGENYLRISRFVAHSGQRQASGHGPHDGSSAADAQTVKRLATAREGLAAIAQLTDQQLDAVPAKDSFRFCDGQRTLEQVLAGLLRHQGHQVDTLKAALAATS